MPIALCAEIDWSSTGDMLAGIAALAAVAIAYKGLSVWRHQLQGEKDFETARKVLVNVYRIRDAIQSVRDPVLSLSREAVESGGQIAEEQRIYGERIANLTSAWSLAYEAMCEAEANWGKSAVDAIRSLRKVSGEMRGAIWMHFWLKGAYAGPGATVDNNPDRVAENNEIVYRTSFDSSEDAFSKSVNDAVALAETFYKKKWSGRT